MSATQPKQVRYVDTSLPWIVEFLNLRDDRDFATFLQEALREDDSDIAHDIQQRFIDLIDLAFRGNSPEGLIWALNHYIAENSESFPRRRHGVVRPHWYARPREKVAYLDAGRQAVLKMGPRKWVVEPGHLMHGLEGQLWLCIVQALETGRFGDVRRCHLKSCQKFFITDDARRKYCTEAHRHRRYDKEAAKKRVYEWRDRKRKGQRAAKKKPDTPAVLTDEKRFAQFLIRTEGNVPAGDLGLFIKSKVPGGWGTVLKWHQDKRTPDLVWGDLPEKTKDILRAFWGDSS